MQPIYADGDNDQHDAFNNFPQISPHQHASWSSRPYMAHSGEVLNPNQGIAHPNFSSRQTDYVPNGQVHLADHEQFPIYNVSSLVAPYHASDRYQTASPDDLYLRQRATLNSFPQGSPGGYGVEGLSFNEGCRDHNGQLSGDQYWELSSYCIPSHYDHAGHYNAGLYSLNGSTSQYAMPHHHASDLHTSTTTSQPDCFDGHVNSYSLQAHSRSSSLAYGHIPQDEPAVLAQPTVPVPSQPYHIDEQPYRPHTLDLTKVYDLHKFMPRQADGYAGHPEPRLETFDRTSSVPRHRSRDSRTASSLQSPSPPLKRLEKSPPRRQDGPWPGPVSSSQSVIKLGRKNTEKKQTLACLFCRERKIACGRPAEGSADHTCNQCARRQFKCEYPKESRRGQHKRGRRKVHDVNDAN